MLIIVEGGDGKGKSTLIERLVKQLQHDEPEAKVEVLHRGPPTQHPLDEYVTPLLGYRPGTNHHIICDRWHVGEWVYPEVLGRMTQADRAIWYYVEMFLHSRGAFVIYPKVDPEQQAAWFAERGDNMIAVHQLAKIEAGYNHMRGQHLLPYRHWNVEHSTTVDTIIVHAVHRERMSIRLNDLTTYIGPPRPDHLLVGDVRNVVTGPEDLHPAFVPYRGTSGHYLLSNLRPEQFRGLGIMNACDVDDARIAQYFTFEDVRTVALGNHAYAAMNGAGLLHHNGVPHPQYVRRFHHRAGDQYAAAIRRALDGEEMIAWRPTTSA